MTTTTMRMSGWLGAVLTVVMVGCGGGAQNGEVQKVGPQGASIAVQGSALEIEIPAGAVQRETEIRVREVEPREGEVRAFQVEPELHSASAMRVTMKLDDAMGTGKHHLVEVENEIEHGVENEIEVEHGIEQEHLLSGEVHRLGRIGVKRADDGAAHDAGDDKGASEAQPGDDNGAPVAQPADDKNNPAATPVDDKGTV
jgi:hypothetical protein